jgi:holo-ACP synthase/triphosphoribosyl-dephospho-CoA synthase
LREVDLFEMLSAREARKAKQDEYREKYGLPLVCLTLNIPGPAKAFPLAKKTFEEGVKRILEALSPYPAAAFETIEKPTGYEAYLCVDADAGELKKKMTAAEDADDLGRLFDIDVLNRRGEKLSRPSPRKCLLCENDAAVCSRSRAHGLFEVTERILGVMREYFAGEFVRNASDAAYSALIGEVDATPKPGLVDRRNNGAHRDMDRDLFYKSSLALRPHFSEFARIGIKNSKLPPEELIGLLRPAGLAAECDMFRPTCGVNTHKGLIFSLGLLLCSAGVLFGTRTGVDGLFEFSAKAASGFLADFHNITKENAKTHGEKLYAEHGVTGIRGEAANGFPNVAGLGLPSYRGYRRKGYNKNDASVLTLLDLMANVRDTNVLSRGGTCALEFVQKRSKALLELPEDERLHAMERFDDELIACNLSPGGCADLLAVTLFADDLLGGWADS